MGESSEVRGHKAGVRLASLRRVHSFRLLHRASIMTSVLRQNMRRRMMMRYAPIISALGDKHGESRWARNRFAIDNASKSIKACDHNGAIVDDDCAPFID